MPPAILPRYISHHIDVITNDNNIISITELIEYLQCATVL